MGEGELGGSGALDQLRRPKPATFDIPQLVRQGLSGRLRVPSFQRNFVWDTEDVRKLFDSIWRGFPIGTLLLWNHPVLPTDPAEPGRARLGPVELAVEPRADALWVVDGLQRVTSLVGVLSGLGQQVDERFDVYFDLRHARFVTGGGAAAAPTWLPLYEALQTRRLLAWLREHGADLAPDDLDVADALGGALRDYQVPAYVVDSADDRLLREVFDRVNSAGKPIGRSQVFHALFAGASEPGSPSSVVESLRRLGFGELRPDSVLQSLLAIRGGDVGRDVHGEFADNEDVRDWYEQTERALERAVDFLRRQGVPHLLLVPSTLPLPVLAAFYHLHPEPESWSERLLARWLWRGWVHGFGRKGHTPALRQAVRAVHPARGRPDTAPDEYGAVVGLLGLVPDEETPVISAAPFRTDYATGRLGLLALSSLGPEDPTGEKIDIAAALEADGVDAVTDLVPDQRGDLAARGFWPRRSRPPSGLEPPAVLRSHAIDEDAATALRRGDTPGFLAARRGTVEGLLRRYLSARLEAGALVRPPLASLLVPDDAVEGDSGG